MLQTKDTTCTPQQAYRSVSYDLAPLDVLQGRTHCQQLPPTLSRYATHDPLDYHLYSGTPITERHLVSLLRRTCETFSTFCTPQDHVPAALSPSAPMAGIATRLKLIPPRPFSPTKPAIDTPTLPNARGAVKPVVLHPHSLPHSQPMVAALGRVTLRSINQNTNSRAGLKLLCLG